jgi:enamine deaminase RidA (YjgF/YER057c/UK114 family)
MAAVHSLVGLENVARIVKLTGFVASAEGFTGQPGVINGASELFGEVFGEAGRHARSAVGVSELPLGAPVEVEVIVELIAAM